MGRGLPGHEGHTKQGKSWSRVVRTHGGWEGIGGTYRVEEPGAAACGESVALEHGDGAHDTFRGP